MPIARLALFFAGALLICVSVRAWRRVSIPLLGGYTLLVLAYFWLPLCTSRLQTATDIAYLWPPWSDSLAAPIEPANPLLSDLPLQFLPFRHLVRERLLRGVLPLWANELGTGQPLLGNAQSAPFAPLHLLALPAEPVRALTLAVAWQVLLALLLMQALMEGLGAGKPGACFAAVAYAFSMFAIAWAYHPHGMAMAWIPGVLLSMVLLRRGERGGFLGLVVCGLGLTLSGHPETTAVTALVTGGVAVAMLPIRNGAPRRGYLLKLLGGATLIACLAAPAVLPVLDAIPESVRESVVRRRPDLMQPPPFEARLLALVVDPLRFGTPREGNWTGPFNFNEMCTGYAGLLTVGLALAGCGLQPRRLVPLCAAGVLALLLALRVEPLFSLLTRVPILGQTPHARLRLFFVLAFAIAAGLSLDQLRRQPRGRWILGLTSLACAIALALLAPPPAPWSKLWLILTLAGTLGWLIALALWRNPATVGWFAVAALAVDLISLTVRYQPAIPVTCSLSPPAAVSYLLDQQRLAPGPFRVVGELGDLKPNLGSLYGLWDPRSNDPIHPARAAFVVGRSMRPHYEVGRDLSLTPQRLPQPALNYLAVRYVLVRTSIRLKAPWQPAWSEGGSRLWRNDSALDLFFVPATVEQTRDPIAATLASTDLGSQAFVGAGSPQRVSQSGTARLEAVRPNSFALDVYSSTGALVVSSVSMARGWRASTAEGSLPVREVNGGFLGVVVGSGHHRIDVRYEPPSWRLALTLWCCGLIALSLIVARELARKARDRGGVGNLEPGPGESGC